MASHETTKADGGAGPRTTVLVVDDDADICVALEMLLEYEGFEVWTASNGRQALQRLDHEARAGRRADLVLSDVKMPDLDGLGLLEALVARPGAPPVVMISGHGDVATAVDAVKRGALDFLEKPLDQNRVLVSLRNALRRGRLEQENTALKRQLSDRWELVGEGPAMARLRAEIERVAPSDLPVLITGENGTGKEVVARNLHLRGPRHGGPFVPVNCAAIPSELIESELFGHEKGSFTGAHERRIGHFQAADGGTLFLDEIGDMPLAAQAKVLRALETREITRVGGGEPIRVDIRIVAATNADLAAAVEERTFRLDLFYRLNVVPLRVPPLRERPEDVPVLARHFLAQIAQRLGRRPRPLAAAAVDRLRGLPFPGNVRQLRNVLEAAQVFAEDEITAPDIERILANGPAMSAPPSAATDAGEDPFAAPTFEDFKNASEALYFRRKLAENDGNVKRTAERLGMQRSHLYKKLDRYGLK
ncbi:MAG: sigma-54 dependent transcriptional regulator [Planctomycetota bacterium]